ncbi:glycosyl hydrolase family 28 protein [Proteiniphilum sp. UBA5384]|uniref:glycosyl hydrolase family 28 protein n=1 Tax=Proteiniphilum sp. UBA5384 TaxID=1947279 RepID=UPI0025FAC43F|nr:glycosyl hydrolase family 28 protein [Proteiniphilum sp. UBA5384]
MKSISFLYLFLCLSLSVGLSGCDANGPTFPEYIGGGEEPDEPSTDNPELDYKVWINGMEVTVYEARVQDSPFTKEETNRDFGGNYAFVSFDVDTPVEVKIESGNRSLSNTVLRPLEENVSELNKSNSSLSFKITRPMQLIVEPDGKKAPLLLFANPVEDFIPDVNDPNLIYYGPGEHHPDDALITLKSNQTLYIDEGAVVHAGVSIQGDNITVRGRGIICGNEFIWREYVRNLILVNSSNNVVVKDVILRGGATWSMVIRRSKNITVDNIKVVGGRVQNDDGINPVNSQDVHIKNCFIRTDDDCIAVKGVHANTLNVERITVEDCVLWCDRARIFLLGHESRAAYMRDLKFKNIDIVHFTMTPLLLEPGENMRLENVTFEDIRINGEGQDELIRLKPTVNQYMETEVPGYINDVTFKNISVTGKPGPYKIQVMGADESHNVQNVNINDVYILGREVDKNYDYFEIGNYVYDFNIFDMLH